MDVRSAWNKIFWGMFIIIGIGFVILAFFGSILFLDILLGFAIITMGTHKLSEEYYVKKIDTQQIKTVDNIDNVSRAVQSSQSQLTELRQLHSYNLASLGSRDADIEKKLEQSYRDLARKVLEMENRMNEITNYVVKKQNTRSGRKS